MARLPEGDRLYLEGIDSTHRLWDATRWLQDPRLRGGFSLDGVLPTPNRSETAKGALPVRAPTRLLRLALILTFSAPALAGPGEEQRLPEGLLREFAHGNPVDLAWWESPETRSSLDDPRRILVLDAAAATVSAYTPDGARVRRFGSPGPGPGEMIDPQGIATDPAGLVYVADTGNDRIQVFRPDGELVRVIGRSGRADGELNDPRGVALADMRAGRGLLVVSDTANDRLSLFTTEGAFQGVIAITRPLGVEAGSGGGVLLTSATSNALQSAYDPARVTNYGPLAHSWPAARFERPVDLVRWNSLYVADAGAKQVVIFDERRRLRRRIVGFDAPPRAVLNGRRREQGSVYVADGRTVREIALVVDSPLPVFEAFRERLAAGDIDGALAFIHPAQRRTYREIYESLGPALPEQAAAMANPEVLELNEDRATVMVNARVRLEDGSTPTLSAEVHLVRSPDGSWWIVEY